MRPRGAPCLQCGRRAAQHAYPLQLYIQSLDARCTWRKSNGDLSRGRAPGTPGDAGSHAWAKPSRHARARFEYLVCVAGRGSSVVCACYIYYHVYYTRTHVCERVRLDSDTPGRGDSGDRGTQMEAHPLSALTHAAAPRSPGLGPDGRKDQGAAAVSGRLFSSVLHALQRPRRDPCILTTMIKS